MDLLGHKTISYQEVAGKGAKAIGFNAVPLEKAIPYACEDADITFRLYELFDKVAKELKKGEKSDLYENMVLIYTDIYFTTASIEDCMNY